jgi:hypothetical protein
MPSEKTKEERLREGLELLKGLRKVGIGADEPDFKSLQSKISEWVNTGVAWSGRIDFLDHGRYADVKLPQSKFKSATLAFKVLSRLELEL